MKRPSIVTARDRDLFVSLHRHEFLLRSHIQAFHFPESTESVVKRRLRRLAEGGYVAGQPLPLGPAVEGGSIRGGGVPFYYRLGRNAVALVASVLGVDAAEVRRRVRSASAGRLAHALAVADIAAALRAGERAPTPLRLLDLRVESEAYHAYEVQAAGGEWRREIFKPDLYARVADPQRGAERHLFVEADLGNTSRQEWEKKLEIMERYMASGLFERRYGAPKENASLLVLTSTARRRDYLLRISADRPFCRFAAIAHFQAAVAAHGAEATVLSCVDGGPVRALFD